MGISCGNAYTPLFPRVKHRVKKRIKRDRLLFVKKLHVPFFFVTGFPGFNALLDRKNSCVLLARDEEKE